MKEIDKGIHYFQKRHGVFILRFTTSILGFFLITGPGIASSLTLSPSPPEDDGVCRTEICKETANVFLNNMNQSVDPCDDFYQYACGNFIKNTEIQEHETYVSSFSVLENTIYKQLNQSLSVMDHNDNKLFKHLKKFYQSCMNIEQIERFGLTEITDKIKRLGGWPVVEGNSWNETSFDWLSATRKSYQFGYKSNVFYTVYSRPSLQIKNLPPVYILKIDNPSFYVDPEYLMDSDSTIFKAYLKYITAIAKEFGAKIDHNNSDEMLNVLYFMKNFTAIRRSDFQLATIAELQSKNSSVAWLRYVNAQMPENFTISDNTVFIIDPEQILQLESLLARTPKRIIANYMMTGIAIAAVPFLNSEVRAHQLAFDSTVNGATKRTERWQQCIEEANNMLPISVSSLYIRKHFNQEIQPSNDVRDIFRHLKEYFIDMFQKNDWMDYRSKVYALAKLATMSPHIGYLKKLLEDEKVDEYYKDLELPENSYLGIAARINSFNKDKGIMNLGSLYNESDWYLVEKAATVNVFYTYWINGILIPAASMHGAFFNKDRPKYVNYGTFGMIIGHEISHGFGPLLVDLDKDSKLEPWMTSQSQKLYEKRYQCVIDEYSDYILKEIGLKINGQATLIENFADIVGIKASYNAYKNWVKEYGEEKKLPGIDSSPEQLFWLSNANFWCTKYRPFYLRDLVVTGEMHSPVETRINFPFKYSEDFAKDYQCELGSNMNPIKKCKIF